MASKKAEIIKPQDEYDSVLADLSELLEQSRRMTARSVNETMLEAYSNLNMEVPTIDKGILENSITPKFLGLKDEFDGKSLKEYYLTALEDFFLKNVFSVVSRQERIYS